MSYEVIPCASREDWLSKRLEGIGASEAAVIVGESPYKSPLALWAEKTGQAEPDDLSDNEPVFWGTKLESTIIEVFGERTGRSVDPSGELLRSTDYPWAQCTLDAWSSNGTISFWPLEVKNVGLRMEGNWEEGPDPLYMWQLQHQMLVTGKDKATIAALVGGQRLIWCDVERDEIAIRKLIHAGNEFWDMVQNKTAPQPDGTESAKKALAKLYPEDQGEIINLPGDLEEIDSQLIDLKEQKKLIEKQIRANENMLKSAIGDATRGILPSGDAYSWKLQHSPERTLKASSFRVLRRHKAKGSK